MSFYDFTRNDSSRKRMGKRPRRVIVSVLTLASLTITTVNGLPLESCSFVAAAKQASPERFNYQKKLLLQKRSHTIRTAPLFSASSVLLDPLHSVLNRSISHKELEKEKSSWPKAVAMRCSLASDAPSVEDGYQQRKPKWAARYTSVEDLRETFGSNRNKVWGDLDATTARRLYKTLLPRALLELYNVGDLQPEDLAPLAYEARVAAKLYTRERCKLPPRYAAMAFDGFRQYKKYGKFQPHGMSYDQVWTKYEEKIGEELLENESTHDLTEDDVTAKICLLILERACKTNEQIDKWFLGENNEVLAKDKEDSDLISAISQQLESDARELLDPNLREPTRTKEGGLTARRVSILRLVARAKQRYEDLNKLNNKNDPVEDDVATAAFAARGDTATTMFRLVNAVTLPMHQSPKRRWNDRKLKVNHRRKTWQERYRTNRTK